MEQIFGVGGKPSYSWVLLLGLAPALGLVEPHSSSEPQRKAGHIKVWSFKYWTMKDRGAEAF